MKNLINAIIADIQETMTVPFLVETFLKFFEGVHNNDPEFPDDAQLMLSLSVGDLRQLGAFWNHLEVSDRLAAYITSACNAQLFGEVTMLAAESIDDMLAIAHAPSDNARAALTMVRAHMNLKYPGEELDVILAQRLIAEEAAKLDNGVERAIRTLTSAMEGEDPMIHAAPATLQ
jgi:hypothetical protein